MMLEGLPNLSNETSNEILCMRAGPPLKFQGDVYDEFADRMGVQSFICRQVSKFADEMPLPGKKRLVFEKKIFPWGGGVTLPPPSLKPL